MVCKPFGQFINIWIFLSFLASLKNLSKNQKVVPFPGKRVNYRWSFVGHVWHVQMLFWAHFVHLWVSPLKRSQVGHFIYCPRPGTHRPFCLLAAFHLHYVALNRWLTLSSLSRDPSKLYFGWPGFSVHDKCWFRPTMWWCCLSAHSSVQALCNYCNISRHTLLILCKKNREEKN